MATRDDSNLEATVATLERRNEKLSALLEVTKALTVERDFDALLDLILQQSVKTVDADRGSLFIAAHERGELWSKIAHGEAEVIRVPIGTGIAGAVAASGEPLNIADAYADPRFNPEVDRITGYHTQSILCVPMLGSKGAVVGVVQALNHSSGTFSADDEELLMAFGANAAAAIENAGLYEEIERLFEGFVRASVTAIEARDPTTAGHSSRVADLSVTLMTALERSEGPYEGVSFSVEELREMRYAALLHDFGKVGVREHVLLKANKLYPHELDLLEARFEEARRAAEVQMLQTQIDGLRGGRPQDLPEIRARFEQRLAELNEFLELIRRCNRPTILEEGGFDRLQDVAKATFVDSSSNERALLLPEELVNLSIGRGSLNDDERREIESHVVHTYNFLNRIPWTGALRRIPEFAGGHHEKLSGRGYPRGVQGTDIPLQTRMMTIADIFDALTASDRPYKKAMPFERALDILTQEAKAGHLDNALLRIFIEAEIPARALHVTGDSA